MRRDSAQGLIRVSGGQVIWRKLYISYFISCHTPIGRLHITTSVDSRSFRHRSYFSTLQRAKKLGCICHTCWMLLNCFFAICARFREYGQPILPTSPPSQPCARRQSRVMAVHLLQYTKFFMMMATISVRECVPACENRT